MTVSQPPVPSPSMEVSTDSIESEKVRRPYRFGKNLPLQAKGIQPENLFPFTSVQWRPTAAETSDWRKSRYNKQKRNSIQSVEYYRSVCCSDILWGRYFLTAEWSGQAVNCAPSRKINPFFRPPANIRPCPAELLLPSFAIFMLKILKYKVSQVI